MNNPDEFPVVNQRLVEELEKVFPMKDFDTTVSMRDIDFHHGQRSVLRFLWSKFKDQNENILTQKDY